MATKNKRSLSNFNSNSIPTRGISGEYYGDWSNAGQYIDNGYSFLDYINPAWYVDMMLDDANTRRIARENNISYNEAREVLNEYKSQFSTGVAPIGGRAGGFRVNTTQINRYANQAKRTMAQSRQAARNQIRNKPNGNPKIYNETSSPQQQAREYFTGNPQGLPNGWVLTNNGNTPTYTNINTGAAYRLNPKSRTGSKSTSKGSAPDPISGLEGTLKIRDNKAIAGVVGGTALGTGLFLADNYFQPMQYFARNNQTDTVASKSKENSNVQTSTTNQTDIAVNDSRENSNVQTSKNDNSYAYGRLRGFASPALGSYNINGINDAVTNAIIAGVPTRLKYKRNNDSVINRSDSISDTSNKTTAINNRTAASNAASNAAAKKPVSENKESTEIDNGNGTFSIDIKKGDSLWKIARRYTGKGINYKELLEYNNIDNPNLIYAGDKLNIPESWKNRKRSLEDGGK